MSLRFAGLTLPVTAALFLSACATLAPEPEWKRAVAGDGPGNPALVAAHSVKVSNLPKSRSGNRSEYEVFGIRYAVLDSALDFKERGIASWYGSKFHGNATASGEIYDMHQLTAAHKHLPLPTFVRVTRVDNGQSIVVRVNDRGPFVGDRIIDLSYAAAAKLDMLESGKAEVVVEALSHHEPSAGDSVPAGETKPATLQVGAFRDRANAQSLIQHITSTTGLRVFLDFEQAHQLYRVHVGPFQDKSAFEAALKGLDSAGVGYFHVDNVVH